MRLETPFIFEVAKSMMSSTGPGLDSKIVAAPTETTQIHFSSSDVPRNRTSQSGLTARAAVSRWCSFRMGSTTEGRGLGDSQLNGSSLVGVHGGHGIPRHQ